MATTSATMTTRAEESYSSSHIVAGVFHQVARIQVHS
jgi:hypothetical protein